MTYTEIRNQDPLMGATPAETVANYRKAADRRAFRALPAYRSALPAGHK